MLMMIVLVVVLMLHIVQPSGAADGAIASADCALVMVLMVRWL